MDQFLFSGLGIICFIASVYYYVQGEKAIYDFKTSDYMKYKCISVLVVFPSALFSTAATWDNKRALASVVSILFFYSLGLALKLVISKIERDYKFQERHSNN